MEQLKQLIQAILQGDQTAMQQFQQLAQDPQQGPQVIQAIQSMAEQGDPDAQQFVQMLSQGQQGGAPMSAKLGGKLRTVARLNNVCPEGYELKVFKAGGTICKKCMKAQGGDKVKPAKPKGKTTVANEYKANKKKPTVKYDDSKSDSTAYSNMTFKEKMDYDMKKDSADVARSKKKVIKKNAQGGIITVTPEAIEAFKSLSLKCGGSMKTFKEKKALVGKKGNKMKKKPMA